MVAFFCSTPYQILIACQLKLTLLRESPADLYLLPHVDMSDWNFQALEDSGLFRSINRIAFLERQKKRKLSTIARYVYKSFVFVNYRKIVEKYIRFHETFYEAVYFSYPDVIIQLSAKYFLSRNKNMRVNLFEDGVGGYTNRILEKSAFRKIFDFLFRFSEASRIHDRLCFCPELFEGDNYTPVRKIPPIAPENNDLVCILQKFFRFDDMLIPQRFIFLDQQMENVNHYFVYLLNNTIFPLLSEDLAVKLHPRSPPDKYDSRINTRALKSVVPWEIICADMDISNKILISWFSTASITPKTLFNKEPVIIFLFKIKELDIQMSGRNIRFADKFCNSYADRSRIFFPQSIEELKKILSGLNSIQQGDFL